MVVGVAHGNLGESLLTRRPVAQDIREFFPATLELVALTALLIAAGGISLGVLSARYANTWFDSLVRLFSYLGICTPAFAWAVILMLLFAFVWHVFPTHGRLSDGMLPPPTITGMYTIDALMTGQPALFWDALKHLFLPAIALALPPMSQAARMTRSSMAENQGKDYISSMIAYGVRPALLREVSPETLADLSDYGHGIGRGLHLRVCLYGRANLWFSRIGALWNSGHAEQGCERNCWSCGDAGSRIRHPEHCRRHSGGVPGPAHPFVGEECLI